MRFRSMFMAAGALACISSVTALINCPTPSAPNKCPNCPVGSYASTSPNFCTACPDSFTTTGTGSTSSGQCICPAGSFVTTSHGTSSCTVCPAGQYSTTSGSTQCSVCPDGQTTSGTGSTSQNQCSGCTAGQAGTGGVCTACASGKFSSVVGATSCCTCCTGWKSTSSSGSTSCTQCGSGFTSTPGGSCTASGSPPVPPSTCSETVSGGVATCPATTTIQPTHGLGKRKRSLTCMRGYQRCAQYAGLGGFECVDTANDPESCGGCVVPEGISQRDMDNGYDEASGQDCTAIPGVSATTCRRGQCVIEKCRKGFAKVRDANGQQYCKKSIQVNQSQNHWGSFP